MEWGQGQGGSTVADGTQTFVRQFVVIARMEPERTTSDGRIDLVADHPCGTYIFELKVDRPSAL